MRSVGRGWSWFAAATLLEEEDAAAAILLEEEDAAAATLLDEEDAAAAVLLVEEDSAATLRLEDDATSAVLMKEEELPPPAVLADMRWSPLCVEMFSDSTPGASAASILLISSSLTRFGLTSEPRFALTLVPPPSSFSIFLCCLMLTGAES